MKIYAIRHSAGEYDDYRSWMNKICFSDKTKAEEFKNSYNDNLKDRIEEERIKGEKCDDIQDDNSCDYNCEKCEYNSNYFGIVGEHKCSIIEFELVE